MSDNEKSRLPNEITIPDSAEVLRLKTQLAERTAEVEKLNIASKADDERLLKAAEMVSMPSFGCDTAEHLADEILAHRATIAAQKLTMKELRGFANEQENRANTLEHEVAAQKERIVELEAAQEGWKAVKSEFTKEIVAQKVEIERLKKDKVIPIPPDKNDDVGFWIEYSQQLRGIAQQALCKKEKVEIEFTILKSQESPADAWRRAMEVVRYSVGSRCIFN